MANLRSDAIRRRSLMAGTDKLKYVLEKLQRRLPRGNKINFGNKPPISSSYNMDYEDYSVRFKQYVPEDVKEGHFAVIAALGDEPQRAVLPLSCLTHPRFLRLLEEAAEEYGFDHDQGVLVIPCGLAELQRIILEQNARQLLHANGIISPRRNSWS